MLLVCACLSAALADAIEVGLAGLTTSKAMLIVEGGDPQTIAVGQSLDGVKLLAIQGDQALVEVEGRKRYLRVGQHAVGNGNGEGGGKAVLTADGQGHYFVSGTVNGVMVRFLVDTGATMVSLGAGDARRIGLDVSKGMHGTTMTANGQAQVTKITLDTVRVGDITAHNVDALVHQTELPVALLGMSFLNRMEMQRNGDTMTLKKRF